MPNLILKNFPAALSVRLFLVIYAMGRITGYASPEGTVSYTYDANGNVLTVTDSHGTVRRTYDALNRVSSYTDTYGNVIRYEYDAIGNHSL